MLLRRWRSLPEPRRLKSAIKHLPLMNATSGYSTSEPKQAETNTESSRVQSFPKHLSKLPPWFDVPPVFMNKDSLQTVHADALEFLELERKMRTTFYKKFRPFLVSRCLLSTYPLGGRWMKKIHFMNKAIIGHFPYYVTSSTLMKLLITRREEQHGPILKSLVDNRIVVLENWMLEPTTIQVLFYDHGLMLSPQCGSPSDSIIYKAECDACFYEDGKSPSAKLLAQTSLPVGSKGQTSSMQHKGKKTPSGTAALASFIWKHGKPFECQAIRGIRCVGSQHAEANAILSVLKRGRQHGIEVMDLVTDCEENCDIMMGERSPFQSEHPSTCMAFIQASKEYTVVKCRWEPREMISHVNDIARAAFFSEGWNLKEILEEKSPHFWGMPFVRVNQNRKKTEAWLGKAKVKRKRIKCAGTYFLSVAENEQKADAFEGLVDGLDLSFIVVLVNSDASACKVIRILGSTYSCAVWMGGLKISQIGDPNSPRSAYILVDQTVVPFFPNEKALVVVYDNPTNPIQYNITQDTEGVIPVHIIGPQEIKPHSAREVDPFLFGFFHYPGTSGVVLKENPDSSDDEDGISDESSDED